MSTTRTLTEAVRAELGPRFRDAGDLALSKSCPKEAAEIWGDFAEKCADAAGELIIIEMECRTRQRANMADHEASKTPAPVGLFEQP